jgi:hypothetical protein
MGAAGSFTRVADDIQVGDIGQGLKTEAIHIRI